MRILGVDPGTWRMGAGIIETRGNAYQLIHAETLVMKSGLEISRRLVEIHSGLLRIIELFHPEVLALENVFYGKDVLAMVRIGEARACAMLAASERNMAVTEYPPARVKQAVSGNGRATKEQVQHMIKTLLGMKTVPPPDSADALAVAICHAQNLGRGAVSCEKSEPGSLADLLSKTKKKKAGWSKEFLISRMKA